MPCKHCDKSEKEHGMFSDHEYEEELEDFEEAVSIPGSLSGVSIGAKRHKDQIKEIECSPCKRFDKLHDALTRGY